MIDNTNHLDITHAKLSASGSSRWLNCPGSIKAEEVYKNESSIYAQEGTLAHEVADLCLQKEKDADFYVDKKVSGHIINLDMTKHVQEYLDYVRSHETDNSKLFTEERVDFSNVVPGGFGTMDSAVLDYNTGKCHIFDFKYGKGVEVDAFKNTQGQLYAIGLYNELSFMGEISSFRIHIVQPRMYNYSNWDITIKDLVKFSKWARERAQLALTPDAPRIPGDKQCQWCRAKGDCKALAKFTEKVISAEFDNLDKLDVNTLTDNQKKIILDNRFLIKSFIKAVESDVFEKIDSGNPFKGYKIVKGRSNRKWHDNAEEVLHDMLGDKAYEKKLITITEAQKLIGKDKIDKLVYKPPGKLTLVSESDKRKPVIKTDITDEFERL